MRRLIVSLLLIVALVGALVAANAAPHNHTSEPSDQRAAAIESDDDGESGDGDAAAVDLRRAASHSGQTVSVAGVNGSPAHGWLSESVWSTTNDDWEPAVATDPRSNYVYELTTRYGGRRACKACPDPAIILRSSSDGGRKWSKDRFLCVCKNVKAQNDPVIAVANNGAVYAVWMNDYNPGVVFAKSTDHGATWSHPIALKGKSLSFTDKPWMAISPDGQDIYVAFTSSDSYVVASHDGGATFAPRVVTNSDSLYWFAEGGTVAPGGGVYFAESAENQSATGTVQLAVIKSIDGGASWTTSFVDTSQQQPACTSAGCTEDFLAPDASLDVDAAGTILFAYAANNAPGTNKTLYVRTSTDGESWSARTDVGQNAGDNGFPSVGAGAAAGDFRLVWQDSRKGPDAWNTWYSKTTDGGATWSAQVRLSDGTGGAPYKTADGYAFPYGDYMDIAVTSSDINIVIWGEGISYTGPGGTWSTRGA